MKRNNKKGFTIVELVIVIAVIAILAGVLIPTFSGLVEKANDSKNLQEARNIYTAYLMDYPTADVNYVTFGGKTYNVDDDFKVVTESVSGTSVTRGDAVVIVAAHTCDSVADNDQTPAVNEAKNCTKCGAAAATN